MANIIQGQKYTLSGSGITSSQTTIPLNSFNLPDGSAIVSGDLATTNYGTLEPGTSREEIISFTGITGTSLTGVTRGLKFVTPYTADASLKNAHAGNTIFVLTNNPQVYQSFVDDTSAQTIGGVKTFSSLPATTAGNPVADNDIARKAYVDSVVAGSFPANRLVVAGTAGETIADGNLIYFDSVTTKKWMLAAADTAAKVENVILGIAQGAGTDGAAITDGVLLYGTDDAQSGMTIGDIMYASDTPGAIASSTGTLEVTVGIAKTDTTLYFYPRNNQQITEDEQDALAGTSGTPSASNKYVTDDDTTGTGNVVRSSLAMAGSETLTAGEAISEREICVKTEIKEEHTAGSDSRPVGNDAAYIYVAQGFKLPVTQKIFRGELTVKKAGTLAQDLQIDIYSDSGGDPDASLGSTTLAKELFTTSFVDFNFVIDVGVSLTADTQYHLVVSQDDQSSSAANYYTLECEEGGSYSYGSCKVATSAPVWSASVPASVLKFKIYYQGALLADTDDDDKNEGTILVADAAIAERATGAFVFKGLKTGFDFDVMDNGDVTIMNQTTDDGYATIGHNQYYTMVVPVKDSVTFINKISIKIRQHSSADGDYKLSLHSLADGLAGTYAELGAELWSYSAAVSTLSGSPTVEDYYPALKVSPGESLMLKLGRSGGSTGYIDWRCETTPPPSSVFEGSANNFNNNETLYCVIVGSNAYDYRPGEYIYASTTAGAYEASTGTSKMIVGRIATQDILDVGVKPGMDLIKGPLNMDQPSGYSNGYAAWNMGIVPLGCSTIVVYFRTMNNSSLETSGTVILTKEGLTAPTLIFTDSSNNYNFYAVWEDDVLKVQWPNKYAGENNATAYFYK